MGRLLREMFGIRREDVTVRVPDSDMPGLQRAVLSAVRSGDLPKTALGWARSADAVDRDAEKERGSAKEPEAPEPKAAPKSGPRVPKDPALAKTVKAQAPKKEPKRDVIKAEPPKAGDHEDDFPDFGNTRSANVRIDPEPEYRSPFGHLGFGGSSWEARPRWMSDPEHMPVPGDPRGSQRIPGSRPEAPTKSGPSPVGRPWTDKDVRGIGRKPGVLSRLFGKRGGR